MQSCERLDTGTKAKSQEEEEEEEEEEEAAAVAGARHAHTINNAQCNEGIVAPVTVRAVQIIAARGLCRLIEYAAAVIGHLILLVPTAAAACWGCE